jgi:hypothetical protein
MGRYLASCCKSSFPRLVREVQGIRLTELAEMTGRDLSSLSIAASRIEKRAQTDKMLAQKLVHFRNKLLNQYY